MFGVEGVAEAIEAQLRDRVNLKLGELRARYGVLDNSLEDIDRYLTHEPDNIAVDKPPIIVITEQETDTLKGPVRVTGDGSGGSTYRYRYRFLIFVWARGVTYASTNSTRRRYGLAVREVLLQRPGIGPDDPGQIVIVPESVQETYSAVDRNENTREVIGATAISVEYITEEVLDPLLPPLGTAEAVVTDLGVNDG